MTPMGRRSVLPALSLLPVLAAASAHCGDPGLGVPVEGMPNAAERAMMVLSNACRLDPQGFRDLFLDDPGILTPAAYPPAPPLRWSLGLARAARAHAADMAGTPGCALDRRSCDGTPAADRVAAYYEESPLLAENVAAGFEDALSVVSAFLLNLGRADGDGDTLRRAILDPRGRETGCGFARGSNGLDDPFRKGIYWVQDFGTGGPDSGAPIVDGADHGLGGDRIAFLANWHDPAGAAPRKAAVIVDGREWTLELVLGVPAAGTYERILTRTGWCRTYRFAFEDSAGNSWSYPGTGVFTTTGEGDCAAEYLPSDPGSPRRPGDFDGDGRMNLSDAIGLLGFFFQGRPARLPCGSGSAGEEGNIALLDASGDGRLDIADPIHALSFLFLGGPPPHPGTACRIIPTCPGACAP